MASFTVEKALDCKILSGSNVLAGEKGLSREISRITVGEVPDLPKWLNGGELILSTLYAFKDNKTLLKSFIKGLIESNAAGLCLKQSRFVKEIDPSIIKLSEKNDFPIINIEQNIRWSDLIQNLYENMLEEKIRIETEMRLKGDFLDELLEGDIKSDEDLLKRTLFLECDISSGFQAVIVDIDNFRGLTKKMPEQKIQNLKNEFYNYVTYFIKPVRPNSLIVPREDSLIMFLPPVKETGASAGSYLEHLSKSIIINCKERFENFTVSAGISRFYKKPADMAKAYEEATLSIKVNAKIGAPGSVMHFDQIGSYKLLLKLFETNPEELNNFYSETIAPLTEYDKKHESELVKTLETYLTKEQNIADAANEMFLHRHTVRYRLSRIKEITGLDVNLTEDRERLSLGLKALRLLKNSKVNFL